MAHMEHTGWAGRSALATHRFLLRFALAGFNAFVWVFVFTYYRTYLSAPGALLETVYLFALAQVTMILLAPLSATLLRRGAKRGMVYGVVAVSLSAFVLDVWVFGTSMVQPAFLALFSILLGVFHSLYRAPYAVERALTQAQAPFALGLLYALAPLIGGVYVASAAGSAIAFYLLTLAVIMLLSLLPIAFMPEVYERFSWGYQETFAMLFDARHRPALIAAFWRGVESTALFLLWPIVIFVLAGNSYDVLGAVLAATLVAVGILRSALPRMPRFLRRAANPTVFIVVAFAWLLRALAATPVLAVIIDTYQFAAVRPHGDLTVRSGTPDNATYVDEQTVLKEIGAGCGAIGMCAIAAFATLSGSLEFAIVISFGVVALAAGAFAVYLRSASRHAM